MKTICLNMIVRNESKFIKSCLDSIKDKIDYWVIVDTGSTDDTQNILKEHLRSIPGELHQSTWVDFAHNRNEALDLARNKSDYILFLDADETLIFSPNFDKEALDANYYYVRVKTPTTDIHRKLLIANHPDWHWKGVLHEQLLPPKEFTGIFLITVFNDATSLAGHRSKDPKKFLRDAEILAREVANDPSDLRALYYLAQSYLAAQDYRSALKRYQQRASLGGHPDEVFWSLFYSGRLRQALGMDPDLIVESHSAAYRFDPRHAEPLAALTEFFHQRGHYLLGYLVSQYALALPIPQDCDIDPRVTDYYLLQKFAECASFIDKEEESIEAFEQLLLRPKFPKESIPYVRRNLAILKNRIKKTGALRA